MLGIKYEIFRITIGYFRYSHECGLKFKFKYFNDSIFEDIKSAQNSKKTENDLLCLKVKPLKSVFTFFLIVVCSDIMEHT